MYIFSCRVGESKESTKCWYYQVSEEPRHQSAEDGKKLEVVSPAWKPFYDLLPYTIENKDRFDAQIICVEMHLLFIYEGGIQKLDLEDPLGGWLKITDSEIVGRPYYLIPITDQSFMIPTKDTSPDGNEIKVTACHVFSNLEAEEDTF